MYNRQPYRFIKRRKVLGTRMGASVRVTYEVYTELTQNKQFAIIFTTQGNRVKMKMGRIDRDDELIGEGIEIFDKMVDRFITTLIVCIDDFKKDYPEFRYYIFI